MAGGNYSVRREEIAWNLANAGQIRNRNCGEGCLRKEGHKRQPAGAERGEATPKRGRGGSCPGSSRAEAQKRNPAQSRDSGEGTRKRSKPSGPDRTAEGEGAAFGVTTSQIGTSKSVPPAEDFEKFAFIQREFW